jgi:UPF0755 protein
VVSPILQVLKIATIGAMAVLIAFGGRTFFDYYKDKEADPLLGRPYILTVSDDDDGDTLAKRLHDDEMIRSELYFTTALRLSGTDLAPNTYTLRHGFSVMDILDIITIDNEDDNEEDNSTSAAITVTKVTFPEGKRLGEMADIVESKKLPFGGQDFLDAVERVDRSRYDFLKDVPDDVSLEGYLFPDTYDVGSDWSADDLVSIMLAKFDEVFAPTLRDQAHEMGLTIHEVVTLASIVEREAAVEDERPKIAQVYLNRLDQPEAVTQGLLQADPTIAYIIGDENDWWPQLKDVTSYPDDVQENPYNTYTHQGLPPGPICNPGLNSILGVLAPDGSNNLFFVAKNDGSDTHEFAETLEEQEANIEKYRENSQ